jgi:hypothetical protein
MTPQFKLGVSLGLIACLLAMALLPTETESTPVGWVGYGIIIGLLLRTWLSERSASSVIRPVTRGARLLTLAAVRLKVVPCGNLRFAFFPLLSVKPHLK